MMAFVVWTVPSPWRTAVGCCPSSLYTFLSGKMLSVQVWLEMPFEGFPDFEQFCIADFPASTQVFA
jgi:hypothetical protein